MIKTETSSDHELRAAVVAALQREPALAQATLGVCVEAGIVTLEGSVQSFEERSIAQDAVHRVPNVLAVANELRVGDATCYRRTDPEIARVVHDLLARLVPAVAGDIRCTVTHGWVLLEGYVQNAEERNMVTAAVHRVVGVCGVNDALELRPAVPAAS